MLLLVNSGLGDDLILANTKVDYRETDRIKGSVLKPDFENADGNSPFYMKKVVFK